MADQPVVPRPRRVWRIVLIVSLALNFAVLGLIGGSFLRDGRPGPPRTFDLALGPLGEALALDDRRVIARTLRGDASLRPARGGADNLPALVAILRSEPLDADALTEALAAPSERMRRIQAAANDALRARITAMTPAERAALADRLESTIARHRGRDR